jgi:hypothetical protein
MLLATILASLLLAPAQRDGTVAWKIPVERMSMCCCDEQQRFGWDSEENRTTAVWLIARLQDGRIEDMKIRDASCPVGNAKVLPDVTVDASLDALLAQVRDEATDDELVTAIAIHQHPRVAAELLDLARHHPSSKVRRSATFWLGQKAGEKAAGDLRRIVDDDPDDEVRERAVFAISQLPRERAVPMLIDLVKTHRRPGVRQRAMFWLAQTNDPRALDLIAEILGVE